MNYYESSANNTADPLTPRFAVRLTSGGAASHSSIEVSTGTLPPAPLRNRSQWVCWEYEQRGNHTTKPPVDPHTGNRASVNDSSTWADYGTALQYYQQTDVDGIGFVLTDDDPFAGIDWDNCRDSDSGTIDEWVLDELGDIDSYTEVSPSGTGIHTLVCGTIPKAGGNENKDIGIEIYDSGQYFTVSGDHLPNTPITIEHRDEELADLHSTYIQDSNTNPASSIQQPSLGDLKNADEADVERARLLRRKFYSDPETTQRAREYLNDLLNGRYKRHDFIAKDGSADRSEAETALATLLFGIFRQYEDEDRALELVDAYITYACNQNRWTADGQPRKWLTSETHRKTALRDASENFDKRYWKRWQRKKDNWDTWTDDYSEPTYERVLEAVSALADPETNEYPTKREVIKFVQEMDPSRTKRTHETALHKLRDEREQIKMAYLGGNDYVYYPVDLSDPTGAEWVKISGEKHPPSSA